VSRTIVRAGSISVFLSVLLFVALTTPRAWSAQTQSPNATPAQFARDGQAALQEKRYADALSAFAAASRLAPRDAMLHFLTGYSAYMLGQLTEARRPLEQALDLNPQMTDASTVLGLVLYRQGRVAEAVQTLESGLKFAPTDKDLLDLLARWRPELSAQGRYEARATHFSVLFQGPSDDLTARRIVEFLEETYLRIGRLLNTYPTETIPVVLYTQQQFRGSLAPDWATAYYDGRIKIPTDGALTDPALLKSALAHEFTHALVAQLGASAAPRWLNEGLAELLESDDFTRVERVLARYPRRFRLSELEPPLNRLNADDASLAYAQSAFAVRKMVDLRGISAVVSLLQAIARGVPFATAFQQSISMRYEDFSSMVERY
jgi:tetratricopeptide (TPR) repeat protein